MSNQQKPTQAQMREWIMAQIARATIDDVSISKTYGQRHHVLTVNILIPDA